MQPEKFYGAGAFAVGLVLTLILAAYLTPRAWWKRPNARALLILIAGAWGFGTLILCFVHIKPADAVETAPAVAVSLPPATIEAPATGGPQATALIAGQPFQVHCYLNLRASAGTHARRIAVVPTGATVTPTGARDGDWWQIKANVDGAESVGWVSSLWLRRSGE